MSGLPQDTEPNSLWECLHDGELESACSDLLARTLTLVVDVPFHWEFHDLPASTRFHLVLESLRVVEALSFEPWPGQEDIPPSTPWREAEKQRELHYAKGRLASTAWSEIISELEHDTLRVISAEVTHQPMLLLTLEVINSSGMIFRELRFQADKMRFFLGSERELTFEEFITFGRTYWEDWSSRSKEAMGAISKT